MSEVMIRGMEMPKACWECPLKVHLFQQLWCTPSNKVIDRGDNTEREPDCPLVEVPPHGRLIDADFEERHYTSMTVNPTPDVTKQDKRNSLIIIEALQKAKTIIEAEGDET